MNKVFVDIVLCCNITVPLFLVWDARIGLCNFYSFSNSGWAVGPVLACHVRSVRKVLHSISNALLVFLHDRKIAHPITTSSAGQLEEFKLFQLQCELQ